MSALTPTQDSMVYHLAAQMMAAATSDADTARIDRALDLVKTVQRMPTRADLFIVNSATTADTAYSVHQGQCNCDDASKRDARRCKHAIAVQLFCQLERAEVDAEQTEDDNYYCVLCDEVIPAVAVVETRWGFMHERCAASEPRDAEQVAVRIDPEDSILDLWPGEPCDLPAQCARCHTEPICHNHRDGLGADCISRELFGEEV